MEFRVEREASLITEGEEPSLSLDDNGVVVVVVVVVVPVGGVEGDRSLPLISLNQSGSRSSSSLLRPPRCRPGTPRFLEYLDLFYFYFYSYFHLHFYFILRKGIKERTEERV